MTIQKCMCHNCTNAGTTRLSLYRRGGRNAYLCDFHAEELESYFTENERYQGTEKKNGFTFSQELEVSYIDTKARVELLASGYIPTADCTVFAEMKSPITRGLNSLAKHCVTIERLQNDGNLSTNDTFRYAVGTHLHVGHVESINPITMNYMRRFYHSLFVPLCEAMQSNPEATEQLFGRDFGGWAIAIDRMSCPTTHKNFINMEHDYTVEFRLCKFQTAEQYMRVTHFCKEVMEIVIKNFVLHFGEDTNIPKDTRRYPTMKDYRKHKADVTAQKLVKLFEKYAK